MTAQSSLDKFRHAYRRYWEGVEKSLVEQYHCDPDTAIDRSSDKQAALEEENDGFRIPAQPPERMAQEIFMERIDV